MSSTTTSRKKKTQEKRERRPPEKQEIYQMPEVMKMQTNEIPFNRNLQEVILLSLVFLEWMGEFCYFIPSRLLLFLPVTRSKRDFFYKSKLFKEKRKLIPTSLFDSKSDSRGHHEYNGRQSLSFLSLSNPQRKPDSSSTKTKQVSSYTCLLLLVFFPSFLCLKIFI